MELKFQSPFDSTAYQRAKAKDKEAKERGANDDKPASSTKPIRGKHNTAKSTTVASGTVTMAFSKELPPSQMPLPIEVYDLTVEDESPIQLPKLPRQQATPEQATPEQVTPEQFTQERVTQEQVTHEQATHEQVTREQVTQGQTAETEEENTQGIIQYSNSEQYPPTQMLSPVDGYDLTADGEVLVPLPTSAPQQATPEQAAPRQVAQGQVAQENVTQEQAVIQEQVTTQGQVPQENFATKEIEGSNDHSTAPFSRLQHGRVDVTNQRCSSNDGGRLANEEDIIRRPGKDNGKEPVDIVSVHAPSAPSCNTAEFPTDAACNTVATCWESGSMQATGLSYFSTASSQDTLEFESGKPSNIPEQAADRHESAGSDSSVCPELPMDDGEDDRTMPDEWEGKIIGEESGQYLVAWEHSFIPKGYASAAMIQTWEGKKAKILAGEGKGAAGPLPISQSVCAHHAYKIIFSCTGPPLATNATDLPIEAVN